MPCVVAGRSFGWRTTATPVGSAGEESSSTPEVSRPTSSPVVRLRRPPSAVAELGVLTDRSEAELATLLERESLAARLTPAECGDEGACAAVRSALRDEHTTSLQIVPADAWNLAGIDLDASAASLTPRARASVTKRARVVVVRVAAAPSPRQIAIRTAFAAAAVIAERADGLVYDQLLGRIESAHDFAAHAVTAPLDATAFRKDRIELLYEPKGTGIVRILTAGLSRWGGPDVEAVAVPEAAADRIADVVLGVAEAIANGATAGPLALSRDDLARARGESYPPDSTLPDAGAPRTIDLGLGPPRRRRPQRLHGANRAGGRRRAARLSRSVGAVLRAVARGFARRGEPAREPRQCAARAAGGARALVGHAPGDVAARPPTLRHRRRLRRWTRRRVRHGVDVDRRDGLRRPHDPGEPGGRPARGHAVQPRRCDRAAPDRRRADRSARPSRSVTTARPGRPQGSQRLVVNVPISVVQASIAVAAVSGG